jgi:DnaJ family protein A protein 2
MGRSTKYYEWLGVPTDAPEGDIKKAYRRLALQYHPDKNPSPEAAERFKEVAMAYEVLSDEERRREYDHQGDREATPRRPGPGPDGGGAASTHPSGGPSGGGYDYDGGARFDPEDVFAHFFGGTFGAGATWRLRGEDVGHALAVSLEDLYTGRRRRVALTRQVVCAPCGGTGRKPGGDPTTCRDCRGEGVRVVARRLGPGLVQQMPTTCATCRGAGVAAATEDECAGCHGRRVRRERVVLDVPLEPGMKHHYTLPLLGMGDQHPDIHTPGDVVIVLKEQPHPRFVRRGQNLHYRAVVSPEAARTGGTLRIQHLDGRILTVDHAPGEAVAGATRVVPGEGWPRCRRPGEPPGDLVVEFHAADG